MKKTYDDTQWQYVPYDLEAGLGDDFFHLTCESGGSVVRLDSAQASEPDSRGYIKVNYCLTCYDCGKVEEFQDEEFYGFDN